MKEWTADNFHTGNVNGDHCFTGVNLLTWEFIENSCWRLNGDVTFVAVSVSCAGFWTTEAVSVEGELGGDVTIKCSHSNAESNVKYFCKDPCEDEDVLITSRQIRRGRYSITDKGDTFYVTISRLTEGDAGTYQCRIQRALWDTSNEVVLTVVKGELSPRCTGTVFMTSSFVITLSL